MEEKKEIKISLVTIIFFIIILVLLLALCTVLGIKYSKKAQDNNEPEKIISTQSTTSDSDSGSTSTSTTNNTTDIYQKYEGLFWVFKRMPKTELEFINKITIENGIAYLHQNGSKTAITSITDTPKYIASWGILTIEKVCILTEEGTIWLSNVLVNEGLNSNFKKVNLHAKVIDMTAGDGMQLTEPPYFLLENGSLVNVDDNTMEYINSDNIPDIVFEPTVFNEQYILELNNEQFLELLNNIMEERGFNTYAVKVVNSFVGDYKKLFTNYEIYNLFNYLRCITLNPYDPNYPDLSHTNRAYNSNGYIVVNCFENELENDSNWDGLRSLLTHEIMHSLGEFQFTYDKIAGSVVSVTVRNRLLEEGLADSIAHFVKHTNHNTCFAIIKQNDFIMYEIGNNNKVNLNSNNNNTYVLSGNVINLFKYIGCYDEIIHANMNSDFDSLRKAMGEKVTNGEEYFDELFELLNTIYLYMEYPNTFLSRKEILLNDYDENIINIINNNNLNDLLIQYAKLSAEILANRRDKTYSDAEIKSNMLILYSEDGINFKTDLK